MLYSLSRTHTETVTFTAVQRDKFVMYAGFRTIRSPYTLSMQTCFWCKDQIANGESVAWATLAARPKGPSVALCQACVDEVSETKEIELPDGPIVAACRRGEITLAQARDALDREENQEYPTCLIGYVPIGGVPCAASVAIITD